MIVLNLSDQGFGLLNIPGAYLSHLAQHLQLGILPLEVTA